MKRFVLTVILFGVTAAFAQEASITLVNGKSLKSKIVKIEAENFNGTNKEPSTAISVVQGNSEYMLSFDKIESIKLLDTDDMSCYEDSAYVPIREFCSRKLIYEVKLKTPDKNKQKIEIVDERKFIFSFADKMEPVISFFYKIQASDEGKEAETNLKQLESMVKEFQQNGIKSIKF